MVKITRNMSSKFYPSFIPVYGYMVADASTAAGLKSGQFNREKNFGLVLQIYVFILVLKSEYRISKEGILSIFIN